LDRFLVPTGEMTGENLTGDFGSGRVDSATVAVVAACLATIDESRPAGIPAGSKGMPLWKRAAIAELMNAGVEIKDFI